MSRVKRISKLPAGALRSDQTLSDIIAGEMILPVGHKLGPYEIVEPIGAGGMGQVYRARDPRMGRDVAIKVSAEQFSERFEREVRAVASLNHVNVCTLHDVMQVDVKPGATFQAEVPQPLFKLPPRATPPSPPMANDSLPAFPLNKPRRHLLRSSSTGSRFSGSETVFNWRGGLLLRLRAVALALRGPPAIARLGHGLLLGIARACR
jgi:serine/threonine protein kinase